MKPLSDKKPAIMWSAVPAGVERENGQTAFVYLPEEHASETDYRGFAKLSVALSIRMPATPGDETQAFGNWPKNLTDPNNGLIGLKVSIFNSSDEETPVIGPIIAPWDERDGSGKHVLSDQLWPEIIIPKQAAGALDQFAKNVFYQNPLMNIAAGENEPAPTKSYSVDGIRKQSDRLFHQMTDAQILLDADGPTSDYCAKVYEIRDTLSQFAMLNNQTADANEEFAANSAAPITTDIRYNILTALIATIEFVISIYADGWPDEPPGCYVDLDIESKKAEIKKTAAAKLATAPVDDFWRDLERMVALLEPESVQRIDQRIHRDLLRVSGSSFDVVRRQTTLNVISDVIFSEVGSIRPSEISFIERSYYIDISKTLGVCIRKRQRPNGFDPFALSQLATFLKRAPDLYGIRKGTEERFSNRLRNLREKFSGERLHQLFIGNSKEPIDPVDLRLLEQSEPARTLMQRVSAIMNYPVLLRPLGLTFDILIHPDAFTNLADDELLIQVEPVFADGSRYGNDIIWAPSRTVARLDKTDNGAGTPTLNHFHADAAETAAPNCDDKKTTCKYGHFKSGHLDLTSQRLNRAGELLNNFSIETVDVEGIALKTLNAGQTMSDSDRMRFCVDPFGKVVNKPNERARERLGIDKGTLLSSMSAEPDAESLGEELARSRVRFWKRRSGWQINNSNKADRQRDQIYSFTAIALRKDFPDGRPRPDLEAIEFVEEKDTGRNADDRVPETIAGRTAGIRLIWSDRKNYLDRRKQRTLNMEAQLKRYFSPNGDVPDNIPILYIDDLVSGFVPEVEIPHPSLRKAGKPVRKWVSLVGRTETYKGEAGKYSTSGNEIRQAAIRMAVTRSDDVDDETALLSRTNGTDRREDEAAETIFTWQGRSLVLQSNNDSAKKYEVEEDNGDVGGSLTYPIWAPGMEPEFGPGKGTQAPMRYTKPGTGQDTRIRVRVMDRAGNVSQSPPGLPAYAPPELATEFKREEPISPPEIILDEQIDARRTPSRSLHVMTCGNDRRGHHDDRRIFIPPRIAFDQAVLHGLMDGSNANPRNGYTDIPLDKYGNIRTTTIKNDPNEQDVDECDRARYPYAGGDRAADIVNPYLPDPLAQKIFCAVTCFDGYRVDSRNRFGSWNFYRDRKQAELLDQKIRNGEILVPAWFPTSVGRGQDWPKPWYHQIDLEAADEDETDIGITYSEGRGPSITVKLPPAWTATLKLSTGPGNDPRYAGMHGPEHRYLTYLDRRIVEHQKSLLNVAGEDKASIEKRAEITRQIEAFQKTRERALELSAAGGFEAQSPPATLTLVHPVKRPLLHPVIERLDLTRRPGEIAASISMSVKVDEKSTSKVRLIAEWEELQDDPDTPKPFRSTNSEVVAEFDIEDSVTFEPVTLDFDTEHQLPDFGHRKVSYRCEAVSRFKNFYPSDTPAEQFYSIRPDDKSDSVQITVPASRRPALPLIDKVPPGWQWTAWRKRENWFKSPILVREREGGEFTFYMQRGWREGELLGIVFTDISETVCAEMNENKRNGRDIVGARRVDTTSLISGNEENKEIFEAIQPYISLWGMDPLRNSQLVTGVPDPTYFPGATMYACGLTLAETNAGEDEDRDEVRSALRKSRVSIVGYEPEFDPESGLMKCNVSLRSLNAYLPFIEFRVAKYQQHAVTSMELSPVVDAGINQVQPYRKSTARLQRRSAGRYTLQVFGPRNVESPRHPKPEPFETRPNSFETRLFERVRMNGALSWQSVPEDDWVVARVANRSDAIWTAELTLPKERKNREFMALIMEHETLIEPAGLGKESANRSRLVFSDILRL